MQRNRTAAVNLWTTYRVRDNDSFRASLRCGLIPLHNGIKDWTHRIRKLSTIRILSGKMKST